MYFVYILRSAKGHIYTGCTNNIENRIQRHGRGDGAEFAKRNRTAQLVYTEAFGILLEARRREKQIKGWRREKKENLIKFGKPVV